MSYLHPIQTTEQIRDMYLRYLKTIYPFQDPDLRFAFFSTLTEPSRLVKGPLLESAPPFVLGRSIAQLVGDGVLHPGFSRLCSDELPWERGLYRHQDDAVTRVVQNEHNLIVATGTGSGKTETFLIPILDHLLREEANGTLVQPGVRALLLYPMNALANDQLKRLRRLLANYPQITFGRYTGESADEDKAARDRFFEQFPGEQIFPNELLSRQRMRQAPPHILLTNYAMLEYLLLRPEDCELFDGPTGTHWRFIVLDEAHVYDGASGIEVGMLLRRLKDRVAVSETGRMRCIATSATLGRGRADFPVAADFATNIFGEPFAWVDDDPRCQDIVEATREPMSAWGTVWGEGNVELYCALQQAITVIPDEPQFVNDVLAPLGGAVPASLPPTELALARDFARLQWTEPAGDVCASRRDRRQNTVGAFLYGVLRGDRRLRRLHDLLGEGPCALDVIARDIFPNDADPTESLVTLVDLAVRARPDPASLSLLPARYHVFARALEGAFACLNRQGHPDGKPRVFLGRREECPVCRGWVVEIASCVRCGATYVVGRETSSGPRPAISPLSATEDGFKLGQLSEGMEGSWGKPVYFLLGSEAVSTDEDEDVAENVDPAGPLESEERWTLCGRCGTVAPGSSARCGCAIPVIQPVWRLTVKDASGPHRCLQCGSRSSSGIVYRFLTGQDAPVSVLATGLYQRLPPSPNPDVAELPGQGRKLLVFSDSRQDAAFFAPYLERTYNQVLRRRLILKSLLEHPDGRQGDLRLEDAVSVVLRQAQKAGVFGPSQSRPQQRKIVATWLMQEMVAFDRRLNLEGLGLLQFRLVRPDRWRPPEPLRAAPWNLTDDEIWTLIALLLDTVRQQGVVTFLDDVTPDQDEFAPRNRALYVRESTADSKDGILSWLPTRGTNRRLDLLDRLLKKIQPDLGDAERRQKATDALKGIWQHITQGSPVLRDYLVPTNRGQGIAFQLNHSYWELVPSSEGIGYVCGRCHAITSLDILGQCPVRGCTGELCPIDPGETGLVDNHYRSLYRSLEPIALSAEEHTAQWTSDEAGKVQMRFVDGTINVLSCSTTFELGVDVGELQAVLMRNVPPTTANYVQRAGRAGRRADAAAFALTYAQRRSHDLTYYAEPERMVAGRVNPPQVKIQNEKIVRRHVQAVLLASFFRRIRDEQGREFPNVGEFFDVRNGQKAGPKLVLDYVQARPADVQAALRRIVPKDLQSEVGIDDWGWLRLADGDGFLDFLDLATSEVTSDLEQYRALEAEASGNRNYGLAQHYSNVTNTIRGRSLLGFLASRNLLPKYGFPTDVVALRTDHLTIPEAARIQLERDLRIAIGEYAPGAEVVAAKRIWTGGGLYKMPNKDWPVYHYAVCPDCGRFLQSTQPISQVCPVCGRNVFGGWRPLYGQYIRPEFGFVAKRDRVPPSGESRPQRIYSSRIYFAEYAPPARDDGSSETPVFSIVPALSGSGVHLQQYYSRFGKLALVNSGVEGRGFLVCQVCGFADLAPEPPPTGVRRPRKVAPHKNPRTGRDCNGTLFPYHLGHDFLTDVVELRFTGGLAAGQPPQTWRSLVYALLEGAANQLGIRRDDLDGTLHRYTSGDPPAIVLFDNVPGGAGHVRRVADSLPLIFQSARDRVKNECCGQETSCYECLRNYRNQPYHNDLKRGRVLGFLNDLFDSIGQAWLV